MAGNQLRLWASIKEQPMTSYRYRFITEGARSLLYSESHQAARGFPKACLETDAASAAYARSGVTVTVSTVAANGLIHPYYLKGSHCDNEGVYRVQMDFPSETLADGVVGITVELRDVAIICVKRNREVLKDAIAKRIRSGEIPYFNEHTDRAEEIYLGQISLLDTVHLAFAFYHHQSRRVERVISGPIHRASRKACRSVPRPLMMPTDLPVVPEQTAWLHIEALAKGGSYSMAITPQAMLGSLGDVAFTPVRANLFEVHLRLNCEQLPPAERTQCELKISDGAVEHSAEVFLCRVQCPQCRRDLRVPAPYSVSALGAVGGDAFPPQPDDDGDDLMQELELLDLGDYDGMIREIQHLHQV